MPLTAPHAAKGKIPSTDPGEEMTLAVSGQVLGLHFLDVSIIDCPFGNVAGFNEVSQPLGRVGGILVVVGRHCSTESNRTQVGSQRRVTMRVGPCLFLAMLTSALSATAGSAWRL